MISNFFVLRNGLPISNITIDPKYNLSNDENDFTLISGFFQAITSFADSVENLGQIDEIQMTDILFTFQRRSLKAQKSELLFILTTEGSLDKITRKIIIEEASSTFLHMFRKKLKQEWNGDIKPYHKFDQVFREIVAKVMENSKIEREKPKNQKKKLKKEKAKYKMPEICTTVPPNVFLTMTKSSKFSDNKSFTSSQVKAPILPPGKISDRFEKYQTIQYATRGLKQYQNSNTIGFNIRTNPARSHFSNIQALQKFTPQGLIDHPVERSNHISPNYYQSTGSQIPYQGNFSPNLGSCCFPSQTMPEIKNRLVSPNRTDNEFSAGFQRGIHSGVQNGFQQELYRPTVQKLIPLKNQITAGKFRQNFQNSWIKVLMVAIDGRKTLQNLAELLDMPMSEIINACQYLEERGYIRFTR
ncbi:MAG: hypothetical protein DRO88_06230 [Promethearchaeia archaeon]|nr:MAG: hypothetical protein DRO88_06230 [Candidatus Lokiarchaeia archaeon]